MDLFSLLSAISVFVGLLRIMIIDLFKHHSISLSFRDNIDVFLYGALAWPYSFVKFIINVIFITIDTIIEVVRNPTQFFIDFIFDSDCVDSKNLYSIYYYTLNENNDKKEKNDANS